MTTKPDAPRGAPRAHHESLMAEAIRTKGMNLNSLLLFIVLGVGGWVGSETRSNALAVAEMRATIRRIDEAMSNAVPRREFELRVLAVETKLAEINVRLHDLDQQTKGRR
jgi:hypothetical protein